MCGETHRERGKIEMEDESVKESAWRDRQKEEESVRECVGRHTHREGEDRTGGRTFERMCGETEKEEESLRERMERWRERRKEG